MNSPTSRICFCDETCLKLGDCCTDYNQFCKAVDCILGDWEHWTTCDKECGWGKKTRRRPVLRSQQNGGKPCGTSMEKSFCYGWNCIKTRHSHGHHELQETGKIIPAMYGTWRKDKKYSPYADIRRNLFFHNNANQIVTRPPYCARFEVTRSSHACMAAKSRQWSRQLTKGQTVCVECQGFAMKHKLGVRCKGHGVYLQETRWDAYTIPGCRGKWVMKTQHEECSCDPAHDMSFILV